MGITDRPELQAPLFVLFLMIYAISVVDNLGMIILTMVDCRLQTPIYFFLRHLALTDLGYSTAVGPKMLANFVVNQNTISYNFCATQLAFFLLFIGSELFILSAMSYDRYVAICKPDHVTKGMFGAGGNSLSLQYICVPSSYYKNFHFILLWLQCHQTFLL
jgi:olfactory receptor